MSAATSDGGGKQLHTAAAIFDGGGTQSHPTIAISAAISDGGGKQHKAAAIFDGGGAQWQDAYPTRFGAALDAAQEYPTLLGVYPTRIGRAKYVDQEAAGNDA